MNEMPVTTLRTGASRRPEKVPCDPHTKAGPAEDDWVPLQLQDLIEEENTRTLTLRERLENWGSD